MYELVYSQEFVMFSFHNSELRAFRVSRQNKSQEFQRKNEIKFVNKKCLLVLCLQDGLNVPVSQEI